MNLTKSNYFSNEADKEYFSVSQFKAFRECEAKTMAKLKGEWADEDKTAFLLGSYVHSWNEGKLEEFKLEHPEMFSSRGPTKGELKSEFLIGNKMIETLKNDKLVSRLREGEKEVVMSHELYGVPFKIMMDIYNPSKGYFADLKTTQAINKKYWNEYEGIKQSFIEYYDYLLQMAVYAEIERLSTGRDKYLQPFIIAVSKENMPDKAVIKMDGDFIKDKLLEVEIRLPRFKAVKDGVEEPIRCEKCDYCKATKQLKEIISWREL